jgi:hypothetical protein
VSFYAQNVFAGSSQATLSYEYGLTTAYGSVATYPNPLEKDTFSNATGNIHVLGFLPSTTYHFRAKIVNQQGTAYTEDDTFTTPSGPVLVTNPATGVTDLAATLKGTANTDGQSLNLSFEYGLTTDYGLGIGITSSNPINSSGASVTSPTPEGLLPSTTYHYRLKGVYYWDSQYVYYGNDRTFTTGPAATPPTVGSIGTSSLSANAPGSWGSRRRRPWWPSTIWSQIPPTALATTGAAYSSFSRCWMVGRRNNPGSLADISSMQSKSRPSLWRRAAEAAWFWM